MISTVEMLELNQLIDAIHGDPHVILGMHEVVLDGKDRLVVRAFIPQAKKITVLDPKEKKFKLELKKIHVDGFFEGLLPEGKKRFLYKLEIEGHEKNKWETYDPYSFAPQISMFDLYLFGAGTHYKIFEKLGAHLTTVDGVEGVAFAVWAPNASRVSVIGEFNSWDGRRNMMRKLGDTGVWELFIPGLVEGDGYKFEIRTYLGDVIEKSDPYANFAQPRPSTESVIYDIDKYKWNDKKWISKRAKDKKRSIPMNVYELHLGSWKTVDGKFEEERYLNYRQIADELVIYIKEMGYTHIELMAIKEHPFDGSWGYQVTGYYAPTSRYGTPDDFMYLVDKCHQNDIGVILDWVAAHFPKDEFGLAKFDGTALYEHKNPKRGEHPEWGTLIFDYGRNQVKNFLIANALFWIEKYHIDGLRVDAVASMLYLDYSKSDGQWEPNQYGGRENIEAIEFLKHMNSIIDKEHEDILMIAEESTSWDGVTRAVDDGGLGFDLKWNMGFMHDFLEYFQKEPVHRKYHHNDLTFGMTYAYSEKFILVLSHDEVVHGKKSMIEKMPGDMWQKFANLRAAYTFMFGHPGKKLLFMGGEFGQFIEWNEKRPLDWFLLEFAHHYQLNTFVKDLNNLYIKEPAFWENDFSQDGFEWINCDDAERSMVTFIRYSKKKEDTLIFVCNFTPNPIEDYVMGVPFDGYYTEILNSDHGKYGGSGVVNTKMISSIKKECDGREHSIGLRVPPLGCAVLKVVK